MFGIGVGINKGVPVDISRTEKLAADLVPVCLCVLGAGLCKCRVLSTNGPSSLGDDNPLASGSSLSDG